MKAKLLFCLSLFCVLQQARPNDLVNDSSPCPANISIGITSCNGSAIVQWVAPHDSFPAVINIPKALDPSKGKLLFIGTFNTHGYYLSANKYYWVSAAVIAGTIGGDNVNGHLATLTSGKENDFVYNVIKNTGTAPWIGLFSAGIPGRFNWVDGHALSYSNWAPGEPNNAGGASLTIKEPYVRLSDLFGKWNDQRDDTLKFVTEFEKPVLRYKQISGPKNGSTQKVGVYQVCYERTNMVTNIKDTCCFSVTVSCNGARSSEETALTGTDFSLDNVSGTLKVIASPNPSSNYFRLQLSGSDNLKNINLAISDFTGRIVECHSGLSSNQTLEVGKNLKAGVYFAQLSQGSKNIVIKIIKQ